MIKGRYSRPPAYAFDAWILPGNSQGIQSVKLQVEVTENLVLEREEPRAGISEEV